MKRDDEKEERKGERLSFSLSHHHPPAHPLYQLPPAHSFVKIINETMRDDCGRVRTGQDRIDRPLFKCCLALVNPEFGTTTARRPDQSPVSAVLQRNLIAIKFGASDMSEARRLNWALVFSDAFIAHSIHVAIANIIAKKFLKYHGHAKIIARCTLLLSH